MPGIENRGRIVSAGLEALWREVLPSGLGEDPKKKIRNPNAELEIRNPK
jgi:hypothetical protein